MLICMSFRSYLSIIGGFCFRYLFVSPKTVLVTLVFATFLSLKGTINCIFRLQSYGLFMTFANILSKKAIFLLLSCSFLAFYEKNSIFGLRHYVSLEVTFAKSCKWQNKINFICTFGFFVVPLQRISEK